MISVSRYVTMLDVDVEGIFIIGLVFFVEPDIRFSSSLRLTQEMIWNTPEKRGIAVLAIECTCAFWAMAPKGTMSCRTWERIFVLKFIHLSCFSKPTTPRPSRSLKWAVTKCMNKNSPVFYKNLFPCYVPIPCLGAGQGYPWPIYCPWTIFNRTLSLGHLPLSPIKIGRLPFLFILFFFFLIYFFFFSAE